MTEHYLSTQGASAGAADRGFDLGFEVDGAAGDRAVHRTIVAVDVAGSGARDDRSQQRMRADLRGILAGALFSALSRAFAGVTGDPGAIHRDDLGDGFRLIVPAGITPSVMLDPFVPALASALREHRRAVTEEARLRLRVAVHMGLLRRDQDGWLGRPLVHCARLLDARPVRRILDAAARADLVLVVSQTVYDVVVKHGYGLDPATYAEITVAEKETRAPAWVHVPGYPFPPTVAGGDPS